MFIIDIYTWNKIVQLVKDGKISLLEILRLAKQNNSEPETEKQLFDMHLDAFSPIKLNLSYLETKNKAFESEKPVRES